MHFKSIIESYNKKIILYVDMDGVIADYEVGKPFDFINKRPLIERIEKLEIISNMPNVEMHILSLCKKDSEIYEKNAWLDKYAPYFKRENRVIISKESNVGSSKELKSNYLKNLKSDGVIIMIDDDNDILYTLMHEAKNVVIFQDSVLVD